MLGRVVKKILMNCGIDLKKMFERVFSCSILLALKENCLNNLVEDLRKIIPDISDQYTSDRESFNAYLELKIRGMHAFQCQLMLKAIQKMNARDIMVVDIGDSSGTHMHYLRELTKKTHAIDSISVNLDINAIERIKAKGQKAILCRAEELELKDRDADLFTSFEMVEHLHNPAVFFHRLAKKTKCNRMLITVPYQKRSRVGLYRIREASYKPCNAEQEHIFELSPEDWSLLMLHSGWRVLYSEVYHQYPYKIPIASYFLGRFWRKYDFEGFWGAILEKDTSFSDYYQDWEI
ncbi:MAG: methyltransferase domain-containing protein [Candidatus Omnitrophota bacterium]|nr:methyltransferase domain-containing protein [Candidatus Omnitrophota bacterium]